MPLESELPPELVVGLLLALLVLLKLLRSARSRGFFGEVRVRVALFLRLGRGGYRSLHNVTLPTRDGTTQIHHIVVSPFGVFVIETKNLTGWIFGNERSKRWTQVIYTRRYRFLNPLRQNYKHVQAVEDLLGLDSRCFHSVVVFVGGSRFKTEVPPNVLRRRALVSCIRSRTEILLSEDQVEEAIRTLDTSRISGLRAKRRHRQNLRENRRSPVCPRCGTEMVLRTARRGPNAGGQFWGCSGYPGCGFTRGFE